MLFFITNLKKKIEIKPIFVCIFHFLFKNCEIFNNYLIASIENFIQL